jgi:hypothetical protein
MDLNLCKLSLSVSLSAEEGIRMAQDRKFEIEFKVEYDAFTKQMPALVMNISNAYSFFRTNVLGLHKTKLRPAQILYQSLK